jgi:hypothetical protein
MTVTTSPDLEAQILRCYHVGKRRAGTIARQLCVHYGTVARVLTQASLLSIGHPSRPSQIGPFLPFIRQTLEKSPRLTASRLFVKVRERGYRGGPDHFRHVISCHRTRPKTDAYLGLRNRQDKQSHVSANAPREGRASRRPSSTYTLRIEHSSHPTLEVEGSSAADKPSCLAHANLSIAEVHVQPYSSRKSTVLGNHTLRVAAYFRKKIAELSSRYTFVCDTDQSKSLVKATCAQIDRDIEEVRSMCRACLFC